MIVKYVGSGGETFDLLNFRSRLKEANFHDYEWGYSEMKKRRGSVITEFTKDSKAYDATIIFQGSHESRMDILEDFTNASERDILNKTPGKVWHGDYYIEAYVISSSTYPADEKNRTIKEVTFLCPSSFWVREHHYTFRKSTSEPRGSKRYANRYPYRYANGLTNFRIANDHYGESNFLIKIYGPIVNPVLYIGGYEYSVTITLEEGEYLEIDSAAGTVIKVLVSGEHVNAFHNRSFEHSVFEPIHPGAQDVGWSGRFSFDLTIYEERSEPRWK